MISFGPARARRGFYLYAALFATFFQLYYMLRGEEMIKLFVFFVLEFFQLSTGAGCSNFAKPSDNLNVSLFHFSRPVQWSGQQQQGMPQMPIQSTVAPGSVGAPPMGSYGAPQYTTAPHYTTPFGQYAPHGYPGGHVPQWQMQPQG